MIAFWQNPNQEYIASNTSSIRLRHGCLTQLTYQASRILTRDIRGIKNQQLVIDWDPFKEGELNLLLFDLPDQMKELDPVSRLPELIEQELTTAFRTIADKIVKTMRCLVVIAPLRQRAERIYTTTLPYAELMDVDGATTPVRLARDANLCKRVNEWLKRLGVDYSIEVHFLAEDCYFQLLLRDTRNPEAPPVNYADVGFGVSQILPILVACLSDHPSTILIEQPELHIHPRLQAELGSLFEETMLTYHHQVIVETHSEHLMMRIQKLLRTKSKQLSPDSVCVLYVSRRETGSSVQRLEIDENGDFLDPWPKGFFPERLKELL
jgi:hypothetical protein